MNTNTDINMRHTIPFYFTMWSLVCSISLRKTLHCLAPKIKPRIFIIFVCRLAWNSAKKCAFITNAAPYNPHRTCTVCSTAYLYMVLQKIYNLIHFKYTDFHVQCMCCSWFLNERSWKENLSTKLYRTIFKCCFKELTDAVCPRSVVDFDSMSSDLFWSF